MKPGDTECLDVFYTKLKENPSRTAELELVTRVCAKDKTKIFVI